MSFFTGHDGRANETVNRFKIWRPMQPCSKYQHRVCILGVVNMPAMVRSKSLFANKFHHDFQPLALDCMEEHIFVSTRLDIRGWKEFDSGFYKNQPFVVNAKRSGTEEAAALAPAAQKEAAEVKDYKGKISRTGRGKQEHREQQLKDPKSGKGNRQTRKETKETGRKTQETNHQQSVVKQETLRQSPAVARRMKKQGKRKPKPRKDKGKNLVV